MVVMKNFLKKYWIPLISIISSVAYYFYQRKKKIK